MFWAPLSQGFNCHNTHFFVRLYCLRARLFKDLIVQGPDCLRSQMLKGLIVTGPDCAGPDCAGSDSVGPDRAGPDRTCTQCNALSLPMPFWLTLLLNKTYICVACYLII